MHSIKLETFILLLPILNLHFIINMMMTRLTALSTTPSSSLAVVRQLTPLLKCGQSIICQGGKKSSERQKYFLSISGLTKGLKQKHSHLYMVCIHFRISH